MERVRSHLLKTTFVQMAASEQQLFSWKLGNRPHSTVCQARFAGADCAAIANYVPLCVIGNMLCVCRYQGQAFRVLGFYTGPMLDNAVASGMAKYVSGPHSVVGSQLQLGPQTLYRGVVLAVGVAPAGSVREGELLTVTLVLNFTALSSDVSRERCCPPNMFTHSRCSE